MAKVKEKNGETRTNRYSVAPFIKEFYNEYYSIEQYPEEKCAAFNKVAGKWGIFGNFANTPLVIDGVPFKSSEHLFQTMKFKDADIVKKYISVLHLRGVNVKDQSTLQRAMRHRVSGVKTGGR